MYLLIGSPRWPLPYCLGKELCKKLLCRLTQAWRHLPFLLCCPLSTVNLGDVSLCQLSSFRNSLCRPDKPRSHRDPSVSASKVLGLGLCHHASRGELPPTVLTLSSLSLNDRLSPSRRLLCATWETQASDEILDAEIPRYDSVVIIIRQGGWSRALCAGLRLRPQPQTMSGRQGRRSGRWEAGQRED